MLTEELQNSACALGETLRASPSVQAYLKAQADCAADPEAADLDNRLLAVYKELLGRQQRGEALQRSEIDAFNALKNQVRQHPLIRERDATLEMVKINFRDSAENLNFPLGEEFAALAVTTIP
jgi:cell fate (sporulation/competence/biofilm development) regulator YlbF (YheA/YmcA/DUF963 family)